MENLDNLNQENANSENPVQPINSSAPETLTNATSLNLNVPDSVPTKKKSKTPLIILLIVLLVASISIAIALLIPSILADQSPEEKPGGTVDPVSSAETLHGVMQFVYTEDYIPPSTYTVELDFDTAVLNVTEYSSCSAVDCDGSLSGGEIELTETELEGISWFVNNEESGILKGLISDTQEVIYGDSDELVVNNFASMLASIAQGDEVKAIKEGSKYWDEWYAENDINGDGILTYREYGDYYLGILIVETYSGSYYVNCMPTDTTDNDRSLVCKYAESINYQKITY